MRPLPGWKYARSLKMLQQGANRVGDEAASVAFELCGAALQQLVDGWNYARCGIGLRHGGGDPAAGPVGGLKRLLSIDECQLARYWLTDRAHSSTVLYERYGKLLAS